MRHSWTVLTLGCISLCYSAEFELNFDAGETADRNVCQAFWAAFELHEANPVELKTK